MTAFCVFLVLWSLAGSFLAGWNAARVHDSRSPLWHEAVFYLLHIAIWPCVWYFQSRDKKQLDKGAENDRRAC